jgi:SAM-dependent methyltransferase
VPRLLSPRATWGVLRAGDLRARLRALRESQSGLRLHLVAATLSTGLVDALADGGRTTAELATDLGAEDESLLEAWLGAAAAAGVLRSDGDRWSLTRFGAALRTDDLARASYEAFAGFHTCLYRELAPVLQGRARRQDVAEKGELISRISAGFEPFVLGRLVEAVRGSGARRVLDVGCGAGVGLAAMVQAAPGAVGIGLDVDAGSVALARATLDRHGVGDRATVLHTDVRDVVRQRPPELVDPVDVALLANVLYYLRPAGRVPLLRDVAALLRPGGLLLVVTTVAEPTLFSRHFDLLLRAQEGEMQLSDGPTLVRQLEDAGLTAVTLDRLVPGQPLVLVSGTRGGTAAVR